MWGLVVGVRLRVGWGCGCGGTGPGWAWEVAGGPAVPAGGLGRGVRTARGGCSGSAEGVRLPGQVVGVPGQGVRVRGNMRTLRTLGTVREVANPPRSRPSQA